MGNIRPITTNTLISGYGLKKSYPEISFNVCLLLYIPIELNKVNKKPDVSIYFIRILCETTHYYTRGTFPKVVQVDMIKTFDWSVFKKHELLLVNAVKFLCY